MAGGSCWWSFFFANPYLWKSRYENLENDSVEVCDLQEYMAMKRCTGEDFNFSYYQENYDELNDRCELNKEFKALHASVQSRFTLDEFIADKDSLNRLSNTMNRLTSTNIEISLDDVLAKNEKFEEAVEIFGDQLAKMSSDVAIRQQFNIINMGVFNCDQIDRIFEPTYVNASFVNEKGEELRIISLQLVDSRINGLLAFKPHRFPYSPSSVNKLVVYAYDKTPYFCDNDQFLAIKGRNHTFVMKTIKARVSKEKIKEELGL